MGAHKENGERLREKLLAATAASLLLGLAFGAAEGHVPAAHRAELRALIVSLAVATLVPSMIRLNPSRLACSMRNARAILLGLALSFTASPLAAMALAGSSPTPCWA